MQREQFNTLDFIINYEAGDVDEATLIDGFQHLVDSGQAWTLQGHYGRTAAALIEAGMVTDPRERRLH